MSTPPCAPDAPGRVGCYVAQASRNRTRAGRQPMETTQQDRASAAPPNSGAAELLEAADRVVLRDGPGASMNAIAAEAGITKPILYRHFGDKGGLYRALAVRHTDALLAALRAALDAPARAPRAGRGHPGHLSRRHRGPPAGLPLPDAPGRGRPSRRARLRRRPALGSAAAPARRGAGQGDRRTGRPRPRRRGAGAGVGARHRRHDARRRRLVAARTPLLPRASWSGSLADLLWGRLAAAGDRAGGPGF